MSAADVLNKENEDSKKDMAPDGLRQRGRRSSTAESIANAVAKKVPKPLRPVVKNIGPILNAAMEMYAKAKPTINKIKNGGITVYGKLKPYHPEEFVPVLIGLTLCFFGGCFATTIAAVEAFRAAGYYTVKECFLIIYQDQKRVYKKWLEDDKKDENGDGVADVKEMTDDELARHKFLLIVQTVDPAELGRALTGINTGILAVLASLQVRFAKALTLGSALGVTIYKMVDATVLPDLEKKTDKKYRKWVKPTAMYSCKFVGFMFAMSIWRMIMAIHSSTTGAQMACSALMAYAIRHKYIKLKDDNKTSTKSKEFFIVTSGLALVGFYWQLSNGFRLPFPLNFFLLPVTVLESVLGYFVAK